MPSGRAIVLRGDAATLPLPGASVDLIVTSPPYFGLRSYTDGGQHYQGQIGSEPTPAAYIAALIACTREWVRVLKPEGSLFINLGDKYDSGTTTPRTNPGTVKDGTGQGWYLETPRVSLGKPKSLLGLPWRYALACTDQLGLILRAEIIWDKPNGLPESVTDRVRRSHEQVFHFTRQPRYYTAVDEVREPQAQIRLRLPGGRGNPGTSANEGRLKNDTLATCEPNPLGKLPGSVWSIPSAPLTVPPHLGVDHFAAYPPELVRRIILGWSPPGICTECGQGRRPVVAKQNTVVARSQRRRSFVLPGDDGLRVSGLCGVNRTDTTQDVRIVDYACACPQPDTWPVRPAIILDPFGGTGTTALTAAAYGRTGITIDRSADYCRLASWRVHDPGERARAMQVPKPPPVPDGQASLFDETEAAL